jgi:hypothetical protein
MPTPTAKKRSYLPSVLGCRCPRCREGKLFTYPTQLSFKKNLEMPKQCPVCGQATEIEVGFYYGTGYVSYALTIALSVSTLVAWWVIIGFGLEDNRFLFWLISNAVFLLVMQPWLMRVSRSIWISWFVSYDPQWREHEAEAPERINPDQAGNW